MNQMTNKNDLIRRMKATQSTVGFYKLKDEILEHLEDKADKGKKDKEADK